MTRATIVSRLPGSLPLPEGGETKGDFVTYFTADVAPRQVFVPGSPPAEAAVAAAIRADLAAAQAQKPQIMEI